MKKTTIGVLIGLLLLSISATAQAELSPNLIQNSGFENTTGDPIISGTASGTTLISGQWYSWSTAAPMWDNIKATGGVANSRYPQMEGGTPTQIISDFLVQSFKISSVWPGHVASAGQVPVSLWYIATTNMSYVSLYGSNTQPTFGSYWNGGRDDVSGYGTLLRTIDTFSDTSTWTQKTLTIDATAGYQWYTLEIWGQMLTGTNNFFGVDDVSVAIQGTPAAVPIPSAIWLLGVGLLGIAGIRRRVKKQRFK